MAWLAAVLLCCLLGAATALCPLLAGEQQQWGDILQSDTRDGHRRLGYKVNTDIQHSQEVF